MDAPYMPIGLKSAPMLSLESALEGPTTPETAEKFEAMLATMLVKEMRRSVPEGFFGEGSAGDIYSAWLDEHVGKTLASNDSLRMREMIERSVMNKIEAQQ